MIDQKTIARILIDFAITQPYAFEALVEKSGEDTNPEEVYTFAQSLLADSEDSPDFNLTAEGSCWVGVKSIAVHIIKTDEGVVVDLWPNEKDGGRTDSITPMTSTYAFFNDAEPDDD